MRPPNSYPYQYDNYEWCVNWLKKGINIVKHHYTNTDCAKVKLWLCKDENAIYY